LLNGSIYIKSEDLTCNPIVITWHFKVKLYFHIIQNITSIIMNYHCLGSTIDGVDYSTPNNASTKAKWISRVSVS